MIVLPFLIHSSTEISTGALLLKKRKTRKERSRHQWPSTMLESDCRSEVTNEEQTTTEAPRSRGEKVVIPTKAKY